MRITLDVTNAQSGCADIRKVEIFLDTVKFINRELI